MLAEVIIVYAARFDQFPEKPTSNLLKSCKKRHFSLNDTFHNKHMPHKVKGKVLPYSLASVGPAADPGVQEVSPHVTKPSTRR